MIPEDSRFCPFCGKKVLNEVEHKDSDVNNNENSNDIIDNDIPIGNHQVYSLLDFANNFGKMQLCKAANSTGEIYQFALFTKETKVSLATSLSEISPSEIAKRKNKLIVRELDKGNYILEPASE